MRQKEIRITGKGLLFWFSILFLLVFSGVHFATMGQYSKLLDRDWIADNILHIPAKRGDRRFDEKVEYRMKTYNEDRPTAEKEVERFYRSPD